MATDEDDTLESRESNVAPVIRLPPLRVSTRDRWLAREVINEAAAVLRGEASPQALRRAYAAMAPLSDARGATSASRAMCVFYVETLALAWPCHEWPDESEPRYQLVRDELERVLRALRCQNDAFEKVTIYDLRDAITERLGVSPARILGKLGAKCGAYGDSARDKASIDAATDAYDKAWRRFIKRKNSD